MSRRVLSAIALVILALPWLVPVAAADETCFLLRVVGPSGEPLTGPTRKECDERDAVAFTASVTERSVSGVLRFTGAMVVHTSHDMDGPRGGPASSLGGTVDGPAGEGPSEPRSAPAGPLDKARLSLFFNATWDGGCGQVSGDYHLAVGGDSVEEGRADGDLEALCPLARQDGVALALAALQAIAEQAAQEVPAVDADLGDAVRTLTSSTSGDGQGPPAPRPPADGQAQANPEGEERAPAENDDPSSSPGLTTGGALGADADPEPGAAAVDAEAHGEAAGMDVATDAQAGPSLAPPVAAPSSSTRTTEAWPTARPTYRDVDPAPDAYTAPAPRPEAPPLPSPAPEPAASAPQPRAQPTRISGMVAHVDAPRGPPVTPAAMAATGAAILLVIGVALYQRIGRPKALDLPLRAALHAACLASGGGATARELATATGVRPRTAEYHLRYLVRLRLLREDSPKGGPRRFAPLTAPAPQDAPALDGRVVALLQARPGLSTREMGDALGVGYGRLDRLMKDLLCEGRVESRVDAGRRAYSPRDTAL